MGNSASTEQQQQQQQERKKTVVDFLAEGSSDDRPFDEVIAKLCDEKTPFDEENEVVITNKKMDDDDHDLVGGEGPATTEPDDESNNVTLVEKEEDIQEYNLNEEMKDKNMGLIDVTQKVNGEDQKSLQSDPDLVNEGKSIDEKATLAMSDPDCDDEQEQESVLAVSVENTGTHRRGRRGGLEDSERHDERPREMISSKPLPLPPPAAANLQSPTNMTTPDAPVIPQETASNAKEGSPPAALVPTAAPKTTSLESPVDNRMPLEQAAAAKAKGTAIVRVPEQFPELASPKKRISSVAKRSGESVGLFSGQRVAHKPKLGLPSWHSLRSYHRWPLLLGLFLLLVVIPAIILGLIFSLRGDDNETATKQKDSLTQVGSPIAANVSLTHLGAAVALNGAGTVLAAASPTFRREGGISGGVPYLLRGMVQVYQLQQQSSKPEVNFLRRSLADANSFEWVRMGTDIVGSSTQSKLDQELPVSDGTIWSIAERLSVAMNQEGNVLIVGSPFHDASALRPDVVPSFNDNTGLVEVHRYRSTKSSEQGEWTLLGNSLTGAAFGDLFGAAVDVNQQGDVVAVGAPGADVVQVYQLTTIGRWARRGTPLRGENSFGSSVSLSEDGNVVAVAMTTNSEERLALRVFQLTTNVSTDWVELGSGIYGERNEAEMIWSVSLSADGNTLVLSNSFVSEDEVSQGASGLVVKLYQYSKAFDEWKEVKGNLLKDNASRPQSRCVVSLSDDGTIVAVGDPGGHGTARGHTYIYKFQEQTSEGGEWKQVGNISLGDHFGFSIAVSGDGKRFTTGAPLAGNDTGRVYVFDVDG